VRTGRLSAWCIDQIRCSADDAENSKTSEQHSDNFVARDVRDLNVQTPNTKKFIAATTIWNRILLVYTFELRISWGTELLGAALLTQMRGLDATVGQGVSGQPESVSGSGSYTESNPILLRAR